MHSTTGGGSFHGVACPCPQRARPARGERCRRLDSVRPQPRWAMAISIHPSILVALRLPGACGRPLHPGRASAVHQPRTRVVLPADPVELPTGDCAHRMGRGETGWPGSLMCSRVAHLGKCSPDARSLRLPGHPFNESRLGAGPPRPAPSILALSRDARTRPSGRGRRDLAGEPR